MKLGSGCIFLLLAVAIPGWADVALLSTVWSPPVVTSPPPGSNPAVITKNDNRPASLSVTSGDLYASAFAQTDFGVLRASASSFIGIDGTPIYRYGSGALSEFWDELVLNVPVDQQMARMVFSYDVSQTHNAGNISGGEELYFAASIISRPGSGVGFLGTVHCGTSPSFPGVIDYSGSLGYGFLQNLNIPLSWTCTLDAPVTAGEQVKLELNAFIIVNSAGLEAPSGLDATHTVKVVSTGWVDSAGAFTTAPFTGASGATYPYTNTSTVPEPSNLMDLAAGLAVTAWVARRRKRAGHPS